MKRVRKKQLKFLGCNVRAEVLESDCLLKRVDRTRARGRQWTKYLDSIMGFLGVGQTTRCVLRQAKERQNWRSSIHKITRYSLDLPLWGAY